VESATKAIRAPDKHTLDDRKLRVEFASEEAHRRSMPWMIRREKADQRVNDQPSTPSTTTDTTESAPPSQQQERSSENHHYQQQREERRARKEFAPREKKSQPQGRVKPGEALSQAQRQKPSVQEFKGTKITFD
jgi:RNA recognition motif-containing protein